MELVHNFYKNSLDDVLDSNINDTVASTIDINPCLLRKTTSSIQPRMLLDVLLLLRLFNKATSDRDKNFSPSIKRSILSTLSPNIVPREPSNLFFRSSSNYGKLREKKPRAALMSWGLRNLSYIIDYSGSQDTFFVSKGNTNCMKNS